MQVRHMRVIRVKGHGEETGGGEGGRGRQGSGGQNTSKLKKQNKTMKIDTQQTGSDIITDNT